LNSAIKQLENALVIANDLVERQRKRACDAQRDAAGRAAIHALINQTLLPRGRAFAALGVSRATGYRLQQPAAPRHSVRNTSHRRISEAQRAAILDVLHSPRFCAQTPAHVHHTLLGEGVFLCSIRTMQRLLKEAGEARDQPAARSTSTHTKTRTSVTAAMAPSRKTSPI